MKYKTENQIFADIIEIINGFFVANNITDWQVRQGYQPRQETLQDNTVTLWRISSRDIGFQGEKYLTNEDNIFVMRSEVLKEVSIQIDFFKKRKSDDTLETLNSLDIANMLKIYLSNTKGIDEFTKRNYGILRIMNFREPKKLTPSDLYETLPSFDINLRFWQYIDTPQDYVDKANYIVNQI
jgi:hypothetical protein